ncbi:hypothetical protein LOD99_3345 [Oopsacas minuta]|uniref:Uncharacterized protein n=1 Tax=Oopsacas minuta TaxID=111878 RepID=A0AAV7JYV8_9METZ|nr:hypothetical protein LOD99_3345 [Oopsacas minuta]
MLDSLQHTYSVFLDTLKSKDLTKEGLVQLLTTLQHCEQTFIQSPQAFVKATLLELHFYDEQDDVIALFPERIQNAHYVALVGSLQSCIIGINQKLTERLEQRTTYTNQWKEQIVDFWSLLPHFWEADTMEEHLDTEYDYAGVHSNPDYSLDIYQPEGGDMYRSGGQEAEGTTSVEQELTGNVQLGASYDLSFI